MRDPPSATALELAGALSLRRAHFSHSQSLLSRKRLGTINRRSHTSYTLSRILGTWNF
jgi:hypothetical protein